MGHSFSCVSQVYTQNIQSSLLDIYNHGDGLVLLIYKSKTLQV